jgi:hypothetical protein
MSSDSSHRSERNTPQRTNARIRLNTERTLEYAVQAGKEGIDRRLARLDREWDTERTLETMAATFMLGGVVLGATVNRRWLWLSGAAGAFLLQHGLHGWCPPLTVIRALGVRTQGEIEQERYALKAARGDFRGADAVRTTPRQLLAAAAR